jgi:hypothetical protein
VDAWLSLTILLLLGKKAKKRTLIRFWRENDRADKPNDEPDETEEDSASERLNSPDGQAQLLTVRWSDVWRHLSSSASSVAAVLRITPTKSHNAPIAEM